MVYDWVLVEADFLREYGIDLVHDLDGMSWRKFLALLRGLSPNSATVTATTSRIQFGSRETVNVVSGAQATQSTFVALFGHSSTPA